MMVCPGVVRKAAKLVPTVLQALAFVVCIHVVGQGMLARYGPAKYRFSRNYQATGLGFGSNKVSKVIKYIDKNIPRYKPPKNAKGGKGKGGPSKGTTASTTSTTPPPPPPMAELAEEQKRRLISLKETCVKYNIGEGHQVSNVEQSVEAEEMTSWLMRQSVPKKPLWQNLICSKEHKISICPVYKAASTFLLKKFLLIAPSRSYDKESVKHLEVQANVLARKEFGYLESWTKYPNFTTNGVTMIFVRHPFERLLSAFRDKLEDPSVQGHKFNEYYYNKHGRRIVMHYRKNHNSVTGPTWKYPRFSEFVDYVLGKDLRYDDEHWSPYYKECTPCHINFTFVGHFETLYWDLHLLANKTGLAQWDDKTDYFQSATYRKVSEEYFATVEKEAIRKLYKRYKLDFELFGYSPDEYIRMGKPGPEDIVEEPLAKEEESKPESPNEEAAAAENESEVDGGVAAVELGEEMKELEMKEDESIGKST
jgi:hypothetical protein